MALEFRCSQRLSGRIGFEDPGINSSMGPAARVWLDLSRLVRASPSLSPGRLPLAAIEGPVNGRSLERTENNRVFRALRDDPLDDLDAMTR